jgi:rhodanese-related sulfurtransferase
MKKIVLLSLTALIFFSASEVKAYNHEVAKAFAEMFAEVTGPKAGKGLHLIKPEAFIKNLDEYKSYQILDVRTPEETAIFGMTMHNVMSIQISELFKPENLKKLPADKKILVVCSSGSRAAAVGTALRATGFKNVFILMGGLASLSQYLSTPAPLVK